MLSRRSLVLAALGAALLAGPVTTHADPPEEITDHRHQLGLSLDLGSGYRAIFPYAQAAFCTSDTANNSNARSTCAGALPFFTDIGVSYGVSRTLDLLVETREGLGGDFTGGSHAHTLALGLRYYPDPEGAAKLMTGLEAVFDFTDFATGINSGSNLAGTDVAGHAFFGGQLDINRHVGAYIDAGVACGFVRWLRFEIDAFGGLQARYP